MEDTQNLIVKSGRMEGGGGQEPKLIEYWA